MMFLSGFFAACSLWVAVVYAVSLFGAKRLQEQRVRAEVAGNDAEAVLNANGPHFIIVFALFLLVAIVSGWGAA